MREVLMLCCNSSPLLDQCLMKFTNLSAEATSTIPVVHRVGNSHFYYIGLDRYRFSLSLYFDNVCLVSGVC